MGFLIKLTSYFRSVIHHDKMGRSLFFCFVAAVIVVVVVAQ